MLSALHCLHVRKQLGRGGHRRPFGAVRAELHRVDDVPRALVHQPGGRQQRAHLVLDDGARALGRHQLHAVAVAEAPLEVDRRADGGELPLRHDADAVAQRVGLLH